MEPSDTHFPVEPLGPNDPQDAKRLGPVVSKSENPDAGNDHSYTDMELHQAVSEARGYVLNKEAADKLMEGAEMQSVPAPPKPKEPAPPKKVQKPETDLNLSRRPLTDWDPEEAMQALQMEQAVNAHEDEVELTTRIFKENLPIAAQSVVHMAVHSTSERIRLDAARYVVERNLGKVTEIGAAEDPKSWEKLLADVIRVM
jgi:hypothetical protein